MEGGEERVEEEGCPRGGAGEEAEQGKERCAFCLFRGSTLGCGVWGVGISVKREEEDSSHFKVQVLGNCRGVDEARGAGEELEECFVQKRRPRGPASAEGGEAREGREGGERRKDGARRPVQYRHLRRWFRV